MQVTVCKIIFLKVETRFYVLTLVLSLDSHQEFQRDFVMICTQSKFAVSLQLLEIERAHLLTHRR